MWGNIIGAAIGPVSEWLRGRAERARIREEGAVEIARAETQREINIANAEAARAQTETEAARDWDMEAARQAQRSWKDELWTIVAAVPIVLCFLPGGAGLVAVGFQALNSAPGWYQLLVGASVAFSFGIRHVVQMIQARWR